MIKKRFHYFSTLLLCLLCSVTIYAQTADVMVGCTPLRVAFSAPDGATSFFWDFKDGGTSTLQNPNNVFITPGTYEVDFSASQGGEVIGTVTITVAATPTLTIEAIPSSGCSPLDVEFRNTTVFPEGVAITAAQWVFDDGTQATGTSVNKTYPSEGNFSVSLQLTTTSETCNVIDQFVDVVEVAQGPAVRFATNPSPPSSCFAPLTVTFTNQTPNTDNLSFAWDFGNGTTSNAVSPGAQTYNVDGDYTVTLSATDAALGCTTTFTQVVSIGSPTASFEVSGATCSNAPVQFTNTSSAGNYVWEVQGLGSFTEANPAIDFPSPGEYQVRLIVSSPAGCSTDTTQTVVIDGADATFAANPDYGCSEPYRVTFTPNTILEDATYLWKFGDDSTSTEPSVVHDYFVDNESPYDENGEFPFSPTLVVTTASGCIDSMTTDILLDIPLARFMPDTVSGCAPLTVEFSDSSRSTQAITNYEWIYDDGNTNNFSTDDPHNYTFTEPGEYDVQLVITNTLGCQDTSYSVRVEVGSRITPDFSTDKTEVCPKDMIQFTDITGSDLIDEWHYYTDNDRSSHCFTEANPMIPFETETGNFGVTMVVGYNGCLDSISRADFLTVNGPIASIGYRIPCATPTQVSLVNNSSDATTFSWDFGDGSAPSTEATDTVPHTYSSGDYEVILTAENPATGCPASIDTALIRIRGLLSLGQVEVQQCKNQPVNLDASSSEDVDTSCFRGYTWHFGHPALRPLTISETTNMEISYPDTGFYTIHLVVEDVNGCVDSSAYPVRVDEAIAEFTMDKSVICFPSTVQFTDNSSSTAGAIETYMWNFGDGVGMSETASPTYTYSTNPGGNSLQVTLMVEDEVGCPGEASMTIETYIPTTTIGIDNNDICAGETINFSASDFTGRGSSLAFSWDLGNGAGSDMQTTSTTYNEGGTYDVVLNVTEIATNCPGQATTTINVQDFPIAAFTSDVDGQNPICHPANITFTNTSETTSDLSSVWDFGNGATGFGNESASFFPKGVYTVTLNTQTSFGCADEISREFNLLGPEGEIDILGGPFCVGDEVTASVRDLSEVANYSWFFEGQEFGANNPSVSFTINDVPQDGQAPLTLELEGPEGCVFARQDFVQVGQVVADFVSAIDPCTPNVSFTNESIGGTTFNWDFGDGNTTNSANPINNYAAAGTYVVTLQVTNTNSGCSDNTTQNVTVGIPTPVVARSLDTCVLGGAPFSLPIINNSSSALLLFDNQSGLECPTGGAISTCNNPTVTATTDVTYTLTIEDICFGTQTFNYTIGVFDPNRSTLPNAFTPDGDGTNDFFNVILSESGCSEITEVLSFQVFDRWGTKVYDNDTPTQGWDGSYKGERQNPDVYIYAIDVRLNNGSETTLTGDVTLIR